MAHPLALISGPRINVFPVSGHILPTQHRPLLDQDGKPTQNYQVVKTYTQHLNEGDRIILKVPQMITAQKIRKSDFYFPNPAYLNPKIFTEQFYEPALNLLGINLIGFIFEQEYQRQTDRVPVNQMAYDLHKFFSQIPKDSRYHLELRTDLYLLEQIFRSG
jgi:hypothetical protein